MFDPMGSGFHQNPQMAQGFATQQSMWHEQQNYIAHGMAAQQFQAGLGGNLLGTTSWKIEMQYAVDEWLKDWDG